MLVGGEAIDADLWRESGALPRSIEFYNVYGPTECTVDATVAPCETAIDRDRTSVGRWANRRFYILDGNGQPVPIGVAGEIHIGGAGVGARLSEPSGTDGRAISPRSVCSATPQARMYKTGDLGRWRADGTIEYLGRNDPGEDPRLPHRARRDRSKARCGIGVREAVVVLRAKTWTGRQAPGRLFRRARRRGGSRRRLRDAACRSCRTTWSRAHSCSSRRCRSRRTESSIAGPAGAGRVGFCGTREYEAPQGEIEEALAAIWQDLLRPTRSVARTTSSTSADILCWCFKLSRANGSVAA